MFHTPTILFTRLNGKRVRISCFTVGEKSSIFEGSVINDYTTGVDTFIELDTGVIINTRHIESIQFIQ